MCGSFFEGVRYSIYLQGAIVPKRDFPR